MLEDAGFSAARRLGAGGSGVVFRATHAHFGGVAVKVLVADASSDPKARDRFAREAANLARVNHPALVPLLSAGDLADGAPYIVMPLLDGPTIGERLRTGGRVTVPVAWSAFERIASALTALHAEGILHRDVKPENVLLTSNGAVLLDLGIAKECGVPGETTEGAVRGTPRTMAPERMFGASATRQSDVYELALLLYTMLVGKVPWAHDADPLARLAPPPLTLTREDVPAALSDAVLRALSTRPERRPATIAELVDHVQRALAPRGAEATETRTHAPSGQSAASEIRQSGAEATVIDVVTPPAPTPTAARVTKRRRWPAAVALGVALVAGLGIGVPRLRRPPAPTPLPATTAPLLPPELDPISTTAGTAEALPPAPIVSSPPPAPKTSAAHPARHPATPPRPLPKPFGRFSEFRDK